MKIFATISRTFQIPMIKEVFRVLSRSDRRKILIVTVIQILLGLLDLVGIAIIGVLGALGVNGIQSQTPGDRISAVLRILSLDQYRFQTQMAILGLIAAFLLILKTIVSMFFTRRILYFLSRRSSVISSSLISKLLSQDLLTIQKKTTQETLFALTSGVSIMMLNVIGTVVNVTSDVFLLILLSGGLFVIDPTIALSTVVLFATVALILYFSVQNRVSQLGTQSAELTIYSNEKIIEVLSSYRELFVRNRRSFYSKKIGETRLALANVSAELAFIPSLGKYAIEVTFVFGAITLCAIQFYFQDATYAISTLSVFLAAGSRIAPAILRIQSGAIAVRSSTGPVTATLELMTSISNVDEIQYSTIPYKNKHPGFIPTIEINDLFFKYPTSEKSNVIDVNLIVKPGSLVAIVGPSGAGKTTLVDLTLGVLNPDFGSIKISGLDPDKAIAKWPGAIAYVPQDVMMTNGSIRENVALGYPPEEQFDKEIWEALKLAQLSSFVESRVEDLNREVGERGSKISGGQRQRLGIARAMYTQPKLLVLDEATSSLDGQTESDLSKAILALKGKVTVLMIAHRLSTVRTADIVIYMDAGKIIAQGTFEEVRNLIPDFDHQASLMGL